MPEREGFRRVSQSGKLIAAREARREAQAGLHQLRVAEPTRPTGNAAELAVALRRFVTEEIPRGNLKFPT